MTDVEAFDFVREVVTGIRKMRNEQRVDSGKRIPTAEIRSDDLEKIFILLNEDNQKVIKHMAKVDELKICYSGEETGLLEDLKEIAMSK
jgi:valyl-tRNA synthetase